MTLLLVSEAIFSIVSVLRHDLESYFNEKSTDDSESLLPPCG